MDDLISRQAAIDALDKEYRYGADIDRCGLSTALDEIEDIPAADVAPVVRCRDCKHWDNGNHSFECPWDYRRHGSSDEDDFCSYGERREE